MLKRLLKIGLISLGLCSIALAQTELELMDELRTQGGTSKVTTRIEVYENGALVRQSALDVYVGENRKSLAVYRSQKEAGQKVLMLDDQFWLFLPSSKRAMRITAMQKMLGEASVGDVASLQWSEDYQIEQRSDEAGERKLTLSAARKGLSYASVDLWVDRDRLHPIRADFYLKSGKLAKRAVFKVSQAEDDQWVMTGLTLQDRVQLDQQTRIYYDQVETMHMPSKWFTPNYLLRATP